MAVPYDLAKRRVHATKFNFHQHSFAGHIRTIIPMYVWIWTCTYVSLIAYVCMASMYSMYVHNTLVVKGYCTYDTYA